jgi:hypothetical protein
MEAPDSVARQNAGSLAAERTMMVAIRPDLGQIGRVLGSAKPQMIRFIPQKIAGSDALARSNRYNASSQPPVWVRNRSHNILWTTLSNAL